MTAPALPKPWQTLTTYRALHNLPPGPVVANGYPEPVFWTKSARWHESTPTGARLPAVDLIVPPEGLPASMLCLPAVVVRIGP